MSDPIAAWMAEEIDRMKKAEELEAAEQAEDAPAGELVASPVAPSPAPKSNPKDSESRRWILTLPESEYSEADVTKRLSKYKAVVGQLEAAPTTGYLHWQLYLESKSAIRFSTLRKLFPKGWYEVARGTRFQAVSYATREDKRFGDRTLNLGSIDFTVKQGKRTDLDSYSEQIMLEGKSADEVIHDDPRAVVYSNHLRQLELIRDRDKWGNLFRHVEVHYIHGETRTGKTSALFETYGYGPVYRVSNWKNPFDSYKGQDILLLDEYNTSVPIVDMLKIMEGYPLEVSARYADKIAKFTTIFIVSNLSLAKQHKTIQDEHPEQWEAFKARLTSVSEMVHGGKLVVSKGTPPQLDHHLTQKPVEIVLPAQAAAPATAAPRTVTIAAADADDDLDDLAFDSEVDELFPDLD